MRRKVGRELVIDNFDVIVVGAGHAGIEASLAAARLGVPTALFTIVLDSIGNLPCNPSIGGTAKGHLVREIDALGGEMGKAADATFLQSRMLNRGKGPAVHSLRVQTDRNKYHQHIKNVLENQENLYIKQEEVTKILWEDGAVCGIMTNLGSEYSCKAVIICTGTYLGGTIYLGDAKYTSGPDGMHASVELAENLKADGIKMRRFKTGTPARVNRRSIDFSQLEEQPGDEPVEAFSFMNEEELENTVICHIAYTNTDTHQIILDNIHRSPLYGGKIEGVGPRYCPSIEDKVMRFSDKPRHQLFIEPCGADTDEMYLQGMSSSLPLDVQIAMYRSIKGFENIEIMRPAYAIEYDCVDSTDLRPTLEFKEFKGLYSAGQFNGSSGYEEAAAQGLVAGVNAARKILGESEFILTRSDSYTGTLIDDLVTKGVADPYRMMTSRSEYRLILRQDNADERLTPKGREIGLVTEDRWEKFCTTKETKEQEIARLRSTVIPPSEELNKLMVEKETAPLVTGATIADLIKRPTITYKDLAPFDKKRVELDDRLIFKIQTEIKYEGYIKRQIAQVEALKKLEQKKLDKDMDYSKIGGLRLEAIEKLNKIKPLSIGQAMSITGVSPADINVLLIYFERESRK